jgi:anti-anti-sigma regulatory factor
LEIEDDRMEKMSTIVIKLPEFFGARAARKLRRELKSKLTAANLHVVFDLSRVKNIDLKGLEALLSCMEGIAKQDGGLEFAGLSAEAATFLELTRMDQLFQKFPNFRTVLSPAALEAETVGEEVEATAEDPAPVTVPVAA